MGEGGHDELRLYFYRDFACALPSGLSAIQAKRAAQAGCNKQRMQCYCIPSTCACRYNGDT